MGDLPTRDLDIAQDICFYDKKKFGRRMRGVDWAKPGQLGKQQTFSHKTIKKCKEKYCIEKNLLTVSK